MSGLRERPRTAGYALVSTLCALLIAALVFAPLTLAVHRLLRLQVLVEQSLEETSYGLRLHSLLQDAVRSIDQHRFMLVPRVHAPGTITFSDGSSNPVMQEDHGRPEPHSQGLTVVSLQALDALRVRSCRLEGASQIFEACARLAPTPQLENVKSYAALGALGFEELSGGFQGSENCRTLTLAKGKSMTFMQNLPACSARMLFPIDTHYTLYLSNTGELRLLSHEGETNTENQPVMRRFVSLRFGQEELHSSRLHQLTLDATLASNRSFRYAMPHRLARTPPFNLLFNL